MVAAVIVPPASVPAKSSPFTVNAPPKVPNRPFTKGFAVKLMRPLPDWKSTIAPAVRAPRLPKVNVPPAVKATTPKPAVATREPAFSTLVPPNATYSKRPPAF